ncbi:MAG: hypothetical protein GC200_00710 [Tepidisphaera sp.]|nr:hypothetical protein [Tepidisphaera sp.]
MPNPLTAPKLTIEQRFDFSHSDARGLVMQRGYVWAGVVLCALCVGPMSAVELCGIPAAIAFFACLGVHRRTLGALLREPLVYLLAAWGAWVATTLLWSLEPRLGTWDLRTLRFAWWVLVLWPLMPQRRRLILALCVGFLLANLAQGVLGVIRFEGWTNLDFSRQYPDRNAGWWVHPAICGYMLPAALGLHLPAALWGRGRARWFGVFGSLATWAGMFATGTRGAWVAGAGLTIVALVLAWMRSRRFANERRHFRRVLLGVVAVGACVLIAGGASPRVRSRVAETGMEVRRALVEHDLHTWSGARIRFARWAIEMIELRPITGFGAGSFETWVRTHRPEELTGPGGIDGEEHVSPMAHNLWLHAWATLGLPGLLLCVAIAYVLLRGGFGGSGNPLRAIEPAEAELGGDRRSSQEGSAALSVWSVYDSGPGLALVGILLTTVFDVQYVNSPPSALLAVLGALCLWDRPRERAGV